MNFDTVTLKVIPLDTLLRHILLVAQVFSLRKQLVENQGKFNPLHPVMISLEEQHHGDSEELCSSGVLSDEDTDAIWSELESGRDVLQIIADVVGQYQAEAVAPKVADRPTRRKMIVECAQMGVTGDELWQYRVDRVMSTFEYPIWQAPPSHEGGEFNVAELIDEAKGMGMTENEIGEIVDLEDESLEEFIADMVACGLIVEHEGVYLPLPDDELVA